MPAFVAHDLLGRQVYRTLKAQPRFTALEEQPFLLGAQGPDPLLFHRLIPLLMPGRSARSVSSRLHRSSPNRIIEAMAEYIQKLPGETVFSYACGFLTHYALDSVAHPYIYFTQNAMKKQRHIPYIGFIVHNRIESNLDAGVLNRIAGVADARAFNTPARLYAPQKMKREIGAMMAYVTREVTGKSWEPAVFVQAFEDMRQVQQVLYDPHGKKRFWLALAQLPLYAVVGPVATSLMRREQPDRLWDYWNEAHREWHYPADPSHTSTQSFGELYRDAQELSCRLIPAFAARLDTGSHEIDACTGDRSFLTGIPVGEEDVRAHRSHPRQGAPHR